MKRIIDYYLLEWKHHRSRKPFLLRGARQIGKTYAVRQFGKTYEHFVEINLETKRQAHQAFEYNLDPDFMLKILSQVANQEIIPGKTLLFIDEIQAMPRAIIALRYFYELMPELHVIAAGSLLDFAIQQVGMPVGRATAFYMRPVSFIEFLAATQPAIARDLINLDYSEIALHHEILKKSLQIYLAIGGMPEAIHDWMHNKNDLEVGRIQASILDFYRQDFENYAKEYQVKYVQKIFNHIPLNLGQKFKYDTIDGNYQKKELKPALDLLITAGIALQVFYTPGQHIALASQYDDRDYKVLFLDIGLAQRVIGANLSQWLEEPYETLQHKGPILEAFVGQELAAYSEFYMKTDLYYWHKDSAPQAEIDYVAVINYEVVPVEVKANYGSTLHSLHYFLETHKNSSYGIRFSMQDYSVQDKIRSYPLYSVAKVMSEYYPDMRAAINSLYEDIE